MWSFGLAPDGFRETIENSQVSLRFEWFIGSINIIHAEMLSEDRISRLQVLLMSTKKTTRLVFLLNLPAYTSVLKRIEKFRRKHLDGNLFFNKFAFFYEVCKFLQNSFILAKHSWWLLLVKRLPPLEIVFAIFNHLDSIQIITHSG